MKVQAIERRQEAALTMMRSPKSFTEISYRNREHSWSPEKETVQGGQDKETEPRTTPAREKLRKQQIVKMQIKRLELKQKLEVTPPRIRSLKTVKGKKSEQDVLASRAPGLSPRKTPSILGRGPNTRGRGGRARR